jgi:tetratricopeptide (TPR) repeat protein
LGQFTTAQTALTEAMAHAQAIRFPRGEGWCCCSLSLLHTHRQEYQQGLEAAQRALTIFNQLDDRLGQAFSYTNLGRTFAGKGEWSKALYAYNEALRLRRELKQAHLAIEVLGGLAEVALAQQELTVALDHVDEILAYFDHNTPHGLEMPGQLYRICYEVLAANHDSRATMLLATAREFLTARANAIKDETLRQDFLANISPHLFLLQT